MNKSPTTAGLRVHAFNPIQKCVDSVKGVLMAVISTSHSNQ